MGDQLGFLITIHSNLRTVSLNLLMISSLSEVYRNLLTFLPTMHSFSTLCGYTQSWIRYWSDFTKPSPL